MTVGMALDVEGQPICCEMWPGNTADVKTLLPVVQHVKERFRSREITVDYGELEDARWFERDWLSTHVDDDSFSLPRLDSIARRLIEDWLHGR